MLRCTRLLTQGILCVVLSVVSSFCLGATESGDAIRVTVVADATQKQETAAAAELIGFLRRIYPHTTFQFGQKANVAEATHVIRLATHASAKGLLNDKQLAALNTPGSFLIFNTQANGIPTGCIVGADLEGLWNGVYGCSKSSVVAST